MDMLPSKMCALSFEEVFSEEVTSLGGKGNKVLPFTCPIVT